MELKAAAFLALLFVVGVSSLPNVRKASLLITPHSSQHQFTNLRARQATPKTNPPVTKVPPKPAKSNTIVGAFGSLNEIGDIVRAFDLRKLESNAGLHVDLAPSFGSLNTESIKTLEVPVKVSIAGTTIVVSKVTSEKRNWEGVLSALMQNPFLKPVDAQIRRADKLTKESSSWFNVVSSTKKAVTGEVYEWFKKIIEDDEIIEATGMDASFMEKLVDYVGTTIDNIWSTIPKDTYNEQNVVNILVLRYPDSNNPAFKLYSLKLDAWADTHVNLVHQESDNGLTGEFLVRNFVPREELISKLDTNTVNAAIKIAENIFNVPEAA